MKRILIYKLFILFALTTSNSSEKMTVSLNDETSNQTTEPSAPDNFYLWCLKETRIYPADFDKYVERFQVLDNGNTHLFQAFPGDYNYRNVTNEPYTRIEAFDLKRFSQGSPWHEFEATYEIDTESAHKICFYQLKSHKNELPQIMCHITAGKLTYQPAGKGARTIAHIVPKENFKIKIRCNGDQLQFFYNDQFIYGGEPTYMLPNVENYSRWGIYNNLVQDKYMSVLAKNIKIGHSQAMVEFVSPTKDTTLIEGYSGLFIKVNTPPSSINVTSVELFLDGKSLGASSAPPYEWGTKTGGESNPFVGLSVGVHTLKVVAYQNNNVLEEKTRLIRVTKENESYKENVFIPGIIEAEDYDLNGEGVAYHDKDTINQGGVYRNDGVDIETGGSGYVIGNAIKGEWLEYTIYVSESDDYDLYVYYSSGRSGGGARITVSLPEENVNLVTNSLLPVTGGWSVYNDFSLGLVSLENGKHLLRVAVADRGFNLDRIEFKKEIILSVKDNLTEAVNVFPNPNNSGIFRMDIKEYTSWEVYNTAGIKILVGKGKIVNLSSYPKGIYVLRMDTSFIKLLYD